MSKLYIIGDRESGILFVRTDPLQVVLVPEGNLEKYANASGLTADEVFAEVGLASKKVSEHVAGNTDEVPEAYNFVNNMIGKGATITDAEFCFISNIEGDGFDISRFAILPIGQAASELAMPMARDSVMVRELGGGN